MGSTSPPRTFRAQLATLVKQAPDGPDWLHEIKYDGYRIGCRIDNGDVCLLTRNGNDWTARFPTLAAAARQLPVDSALIDGEVAVVLPDGRTSFQALQNAGGGGIPDGRLVYFVFDLLFLDGRDLAPASLEARKVALKELVEKTREQDVVQYSDHFAGHGGAFFREACRMQLEGIVSKRRDLPYRPGRHDGWVKTKCVQHQEFVVGGFTDPEGSRVGLGALLIGYHEPDGRLIYAGKVGTGFTQQFALELRQKLGAIEQPTSPFDPPPPGSLGRHAHWTQPRVVAEVVFSEWTSDGKIRHPSFQGLRSDKNARDVVAERAGAVENIPSARGTPSPSRAQRRTSSPGIGNRTRPGAARKPQASPVEIAGVRVTHPDRVLYPEIGLTKEDLARYYEQLATWILPHITGRPLTLVRCPEGLAKECFYMKHSHVWAPAALRRVTIRERTKVGEYLVADSVAALIALAQLGILEIHTWNSTVDHLEHPDRLVLDIDPGPEVDWATVIEAARLVKGVLETVELESFVKTTGGRGLHIVVPLTPTHDWEETLRFSRAVAEAISRSDPSRYTTTFKKAGRERKLLIDYLRNNRTNTSVAAYSPRARPRAPISMPLSWRELTPGKPSDSFTVETAPARLARRKDPWDGYWRLRQRIGKHARQALDRL